LQENRAQNYLRKGLVAFKKLLRKRHLEKDEFQVSKKNNEICKHWHLNESRFMAFTNLVACQFDLTVAEYLQLEFD